MLGRHCSTSWCGFALSPSFPRMEEAAQTSAPPPVPARPADAGQASSRIEIADGDPRRHGLARAVPRCRRTAVSRLGAGLDSSPGRLDSGADPVDDPGAVTAWSFRPARWRRPPARRTWRRVAAGPSGHDARALPVQGHRDHPPETDVLPQEPSRTRISRPYGSHRTVAEHPQSRRRVAESRRARSVTGSDYDRRSVMRATVSDVAVGLYRLSRVEYDRAAEAGAFEPDARLELIDGNLHAMTPEGKPARARDRQGGREPAVSVRGGTGAACAERGGVREPSPRARHSCSPVARSGPLWVR